MESAHIDNRRLYDAVVDTALLNESEIEHLRTCDECLELVRTFVRQRLRGSTKAAE